MQRRTFLSTAATAGVVGLGGCLGFGDSNPNVALGEPDREFESSDVPYPAWGERVPDVSVSAPLDEQTVSARKVSTPALYTFFYSNCQTVCPMLISSMRRIHQGAADAGFADDVAFLPTTFDPERDDAAELRAYADRMNVVTDADTWHFLRPESRDRAKAVVQDAFGVAFERNPGTDDGYMFAHTSLTVLVNGDGYVERAYRAKRPDYEQVLDDLQTVRNA